MVRLNRTYGLGETTILVNGVSRRYFYQMPNL